MDTEIYPHELFVGCETREERAARIGRFVVLEEMGFFGEKTNIDLARHEAEGSWIGAVRRRFSNTYGDVAGCHPADIEVAAEMHGVFDDIFNVEANAGGKHLPDK